MTPSSLRIASIPSDAALGGVVLPSTVPTPNWSAPHVAGEVLITQTSGDQLPGNAGNGKLSAQAVKALGALQTQAITPTLTRVITPVGESDQALAARLGTLGLTAQPNFIYQSLAVPNDPGYRSGLQVGNSTVAQTYLPRINAQAAWDFLSACGKTPASVVTAVLDTGADSGHPDLTGRLLAGRNYTDDPNTDDAARDGHGTAVMGLIGAATNNSVGVAGVTWRGQNLMAYKVLDADGGTTAQVAKALNDAVAGGAKVVNMSLGIKITGYDSQDPGDKALDTALNAAAASAVLVAAAGNTPGDGVYYPASNPNVIAVGAVGAGNALACYSARPSSTSPRALDLVAPGGAGGCGGAPATAEILVLKPRALGSYGLSAGTSDAAPLVSGVASLMRAANPNLTAPQTRALLLSSANTTTVSGYALLDALEAVKAATK